MSKEKSSPSRSSANPSVAVLPKMAPLRHSTSIDDVMKQVRPTRSPESEGLGDIAAGVILRLAAIGAILGGINWYYGYEKERVAKEDAQVQAAHEEEKARLVKIQGEAREKVIKIAHPESQPKPHRVEKVSSKQEPTRSLRSSKSSPKKSDQKKHKASKSMKPTRMDGTIM